MKSKIKALKFLASPSDSSWKVGKSDLYINTINSMMSNIPSNAFDSFYIDENNSKPISTVDFALMTLEMSPEDTRVLMDMYSINASTLQSILNAAEQIAEVMETGIEDENAKTADIDETIEI